MKNKNHTNIYTLIDPNDNKVKYVGQSERPEQRFKEHLNKRDATSGQKKSEWIDGLLVNNQKPILQIIETCSQERARERELYWIAYYSQECDLSNGYHIAPSIKIKLPLKIWAMFYVESYNNDVTIEELIIKSVIKGVDKL